MSGVGNGHCKDSLEAWMTHAMSADKLWGFGDWHIIETSEALNTAKFSIRKDLINSKEN